MNFVLVFLTLDGNILGLEWHCLLFDRRFHCRDFRFRRFNVERLYIAGARSSTVSNQFFVLFVLGKGESVCVHLFKLCVVNGFES